MAAPAQIKESEVLRQCMKFLNLQGANPRRRNVAAFRNPNGQYVRCGEKGEADIQATVPGTGRLICVETKRTGWRPRGIREKEHFAQQVSWLNDVNAAGGVGIVIDRLEWLQVLWPAIQAGRNFKVHDDGTMEVL